MGGSSRVTLHLRRSGCHLLRALPEPPQGFWAGIWFPWENDEPGLLHCRGRTILRPMHSVVATITALPPCVGPRPLPYPGLRHPLSRFSVYNLGQADPGTDVQCLQRLRSSTLRGSEARHRRPLRRGTTSHVPGDSSPCPRGHPGLPGLDFCLPTWEHPWADASSEAGGGDPGRRVRRGVEGVLQASQRLDTPDAKEEIISKMARFFQCWMRLARLSGDFVSRECFYH